MRGKIVFITGASSGIGEGCARKFASQGSDLILNARNVAKLEELKNELEATYGVRVFLFLLMFVTVKLQLRHWLLCPKRGKRLMCW